MIYNPRNSILSSVTQRMIENLLIIEWLRGSSDISIFGEEETDQTSALPSYEPTGKSRVREERSSEELTLSASTRMQQLGRQPGTSCRWPVHHARSPVLHKGARAKYPQQRAHQLHVRISAYTNQSRDSHSVRMRENSA